MDKETKNTLNEIKEILNKNITLESVFFSEDNDEFQNNVDDMNTDDEIENGDEEFENVNSFEDTVNQIRKTALDGVTAYSSNPSSQEYDFFKKIWNMCDKFVSPKQKTQEE